MAEVGIKTGKEATKLGVSSHFPRPVSEGFHGYGERKRWRSLLKNGLYRQTGQLVIKPEFEDSDNEKSEEAKTFSECLAAVAIKKEDSDKHGYIDKTGKVVI